MTRRSSLDRLRNLPGVFTTKTLAAHLGGDTRTASVYLARWKKDALIAPLGPRAGVHFNLLRDPGAEAEFRMDAVSLVLPGALIAGISAVHDAGWTTQIPAETDIFIPSRRTAPDLTGFRISTRPRSWFASARRNIDLGGPVPTVAPAFALADLWTSGDWRPDPDDLEWDMIDADDLEAAFALFGEDVPGAWRDELEDARPCPG